jgi:beta-N-acetylhexosaminidase
MTARELADPIRLLLLEHAEPTLDAELRGYLARGLGGVQLRGAAADDLERLPALCAEIQAAAPAGAPPFLIAFDGAGGSALAEILPEPAYLGWEFAEQGEALEAQLPVLAAGRELAALGINCLRGPALDLARAGTPGAQLLFGAEPDLVATVGALFVESLQAAGVLCCARAFPGLGALDSPAAGSNVGAEDLLRVDAAPFLAAAARGLEMIELARGIYHAFGEEPATFSPAVGGWLRDDIGFSGVLVAAPLEEGSPAAGYGDAALRAYRAGCHLLPAPRAAAEEIVAALAPRKQQEKVDLGRRCGRALRLRRDWF